MADREHIAHLVRRTSNDRVEVKFLKTNAYMTPNYWLNEEQNDSFFIICPVRRQPNETPDNYLARAHRLARECNVAGQIIREKAGGGQ